MRVSLNRNIKRNVSVSIGGIQVPASFGDLSNFDETNLQGNNVIIYDATTQKYKTIPIDDILQLSVEDDSLPESFVDKVTEEIDFDGGEF